MKFVYLLYGFLAFSLTATATETQCEKITNQALSAWHHWADAPENRHVSKFSVKYQDVEQAKGGLVLPVKSGKRFMSNVDPLSVSIEVKNALGSQIMMINSDKLRMREDPGTRTSEIIVPNAVIDQIKATTNNDPTGSELVVMYYQKNDSGFLQNLKLSGIVKNISSPNGRNAQVVTVGEKTIAVLTPEPNTNSYKAILFTDACQIKTIVYQEGKTLISGPMRGDCMTINHNIATGRVSSTDARAQLDCQLYYKWLPTERPTKESIKSGAVGGS